MGRRRDSGDTERHGGATPAIEVRSVTRSHGRGAGAVRALHGVDLTLERGSFTAVMGPSGSGKSTLLQCAAGLDRPTSGQVLLGGEDITGLSEDRLTKLRRTRVGFVFQSFNLLPSLTVLQNVLLPQRLAGVRQDRRRAQQLLTEVGLADHGGRRPGQLSGGQQQRVAIARALITDPEVVFADEPTGALDTRSAREVLGLLRRAVDTMGATVVMVTHDPVAASHADRVLFLADGTLAGTLRQPDPQTVADRMNRLTGGAGASGEAGGVAGAAGLAGVGGAGGAGGAGGVAGAWSTTGTTDIMGTMGTMGTTGTTDTTSVTGITGTDAAQGRAGAAA